MKLVIKKIFKFFYLLTFDSDFREFLILYILHSNKKRYIKYRGISFSGFKFNVVDMPSFLWQIKEIFIDKIYKFNIINPNGLIIDCGVNIGVSLLYFSRYYPNSKIIGFEADRNISIVCSENLFNNFIDNVLLINAAVWINNDGISFDSDGADGGAISMNSSNKLIDSVRLKDKLGEFSEVELLKLDIEGAELELLIDCKNSLKNVNNIFIEYHSRVNSKQSLSVILDILEQNQFRYYIEDLSKKKSPFTSFHQSHNFDLQLNIYAKKTF